jgi:hypothetical protein
MRFSSPVTAAGPSPNHAGFPFHPLREPENMLRLAYIRARQSLSTEIMPDRHSAFAAAATVAVDPARRARTVGVKVPGCAIGRAVGRWRRHRRIGWRHRSIRRRRWRQRTIGRWNRAAAVPAPSTKMRRLGISTAPAWTVTRVSVAAARALTCFVAPTGGVVTKNFIGLTRHAGASPVV